MTPVPWLTPRCAITKRLIYIQQTLSMTYTSEDMEIKAFPIRIENEGKITIPEDLKRHLSLITGDLLTFLQIGDVVLLTPKQPQVPQIADKITAIMENTNLELGDLLQGLEAERQAIWQEQQNHA